METKYKMTYTIPTRYDGGWDCEQEADQNDDYISYGPVEIFVRRRGGPLANSQRPICTINHPDLEEGGDCAGNMAMIIYAPEMYETIKTVKALNLPHTCKNAPEGFEDAIAKSCAPCRVNHALSCIDAQAEDFWKSANGDAE